MILIHTHNSGTEIRKTYISKDNDLEIISRDFYSEVDGEYFYQNSSRIEISQQSHLDILINIQGSKTPNPDIESILTDLGEL